MKFSVVIPTYNREMFLVDAIQSVIEQSFTDWEIVLVDDASTDDTRSLAEMVLNKLGEKRFQYFRHDSNLGVAKSYLDGIKISRGEYVVFQDSDDISYPDRLARIAYNVGTSDIFYHGLYEVIQEPSTGRILRSYKPAVPWEKDRILKEQYLPGLVAVKKTVASKARVTKQEAHCWDWAFHLELDRLKAKYKSLDIGLYEYRRHPGSLSVANETSGRRKQSIAYITKQLKATNRVGRTHRFGRGFDISDL